MSEMLEAPHPIPETPVDMFYRAILAQQNLREKYIASRLADITAPFSEEMKRKVWELQKAGHGTQTIADRLGVTRYKITTLVRRNSWPHPSNLE